MDPRDDRTSAVRKRLLNILLEKMRAVPGFEQSAGPPSLPPIQTSGITQQQQQPQQNSLTNGSASLLPSFNFDSSPSGPDPRERGRGALTPITERTLESVDYRRSFSGDQHPINRASIPGAPSTVIEEASSAENPEDQSVLGMPVSTSPKPTRPDSEDTPNASGSSSVGPSVNTDLSKGAMNMVGEPTSPDLPGLPDSPGHSNSASLSASSSRPGPTILLPGQDSLSKVSVQRQATENSVLTNPHSATERPLEQEEHSNFVTPGHPPNHAGSSNQLAALTHSRTTSDSLLSSTYSEKISPSDWGSRQQKILTSITRDIPDGPTKSQGPEPGELHTVTISRTGSEIVSSPSEYSTSHQDVSRQQTNRPLSTGNMQDIQTNSRGSRSGQPQHSRSNSEIPSPSSGMSSYNPQEASRPQMNLLSITNNIHDAQARPRGPGPGSSIGRTNSTEESGNSLFDEAGALYYMQEFEAEGQNHRIPSTIAEDADEWQSDVTTPKNVPPNKRLPPTQSVQSTPVRDGILDRQMTSASVASSGRGMSSHGMARVLPTITADQIRYNNDDDSSSSTGHHNAMSDRLHVMSPDDNADALAALSFLEQDTSSDQPTVTKIPPPPVPPPPPLQRRAPSPPVESEGTAPFRSSFAPSKQAAERKARVQAQEAASHAAAHKPGRANGKRKSTMGDRGGWNQSSDEEEEDEDDDDDADSDAPRPRVQPVAPHPSAAPIQPLQPRPREASPNRLFGSMGDMNAYPHQRPPRNLPPVPGARPGKLRTSLVKMSMLTFIDRWSGVPSRCAGAETNV